MDRTASDVMVDRLLEWGVDTIFGLPGDGINGVMEALRRRHDQLTYIHVRHEEVAAMAAVGYAKFTDRLGVCFSTSGPGAAHLLNGMLDSRTEQAPILCITGMSYHDLIGTSYLQDVNSDYMFNDVAIYNQRIMGPAHVINVVDYAVRSALTERGPAHVAFPIDFQAAPADSGMRFDRNVEGHTSTTYRPPVQVPQRQDLDAAGNALRPQPGRDPRRRRRARRAGGARSGCRQARRADRQGTTRQGLRARRLPVHHRADRARRLSAERGGARAVRRPAHRRLDDAVHRVLPRARTGRVCADRRQARAPGTALPGRRPPGR